MVQHVLPGDPPVAITLRRSDRARRLTLRVSRLDGRVTLTLPKRTAMAEAIAFAAAREDWLRSHLSGVAQELRPRFGAAIPFEGRELVLTPAAVRCPRISGDALILPADEARLVPRLAAFLRAAARDRLAAACDLHAGRLGRPYRRLSLRDTRSRWGSCSSAGDLMFNWRLVLGPRAVLDYVAAHEVAHLAQMNHSPAFWAVVARLCPDYEDHRRWLRREGQGLHRLRLDQRAGAE